jgi:hypothetical protein
VSASRIGRYVTWTVVSVIPYMFTSRVRSPFRANHGFSFATSSASPPKITSRSACASPLCPCASCSCMKALGVWFSTVTASRHSNR